MYASNTACFKERLFLVYSQASTFCSWAYIEPFVQRSESVKPLQKPINCASLWEHLYVRKLKCSCWADCQMVTRSYPTSQLPPFLLRPARATSEWAPLAATPPHTYTLGHPIRSTAACHQNITARHLPGTMSNLMFLLLPGSALQDQNTTPCSQSHHASWNHHKTTNSVSSRLKYYAGRRSIELAKLNIFIFHSMSALFPYIFHFIFNTQVTDSFTNLSRDC